MVNFSDVKLAPAAQTVVSQLLQQVPFTRRADVESALAEAATASGDRYLSAREAKAVADCFAGFSDAAVSKALGEAKTAVKSMAAKAPVTGISAHFSGALEQRLIDELRAAVKRADGRPLDVNMMIFEFQSDPIEQAIADIAKNNKNVTFRIIGDSTQSSNVGGNALPSLLKLGLPNIQVKFKKDFPYVWDAAKKRAQYSHNVTEGLNHHKGFATLIDGMPDRVVNGSFNWSKTANDKNYEDMVIINAVDAGTRRAVEHYTDEFQGFFNDRKSTLAPNDFSNFRSQATSDLAVKNGAAALRFTPKASDDYADYVPAKDTQSFDVNGFRKVDEDRLEKLVGATVAKDIQKERASFGRFASIDELIERVPGAAAKKKDLELWGICGSGVLSVNDASEEELTAAGVKNADKIVKQREANGAFMTVYDAAMAAGIAGAALASLQGVLVAQGLDAFFNSRVYGANVGGTGYGAITSGRKVTAMTDAVGTTKSVAANVSVAATDLFNRARPGETIRVAMYGMNATSPESKALIDAAKRGVTVQVVLNDDFNAAVAQTLKGIGIEVRIQKARTMHEKFGVSGDSVFWGSANFSESSSTKHSEDRFALRNNADVAAAFEAQFQNLWAKSKPV